MTIFERKKFPTIIYLSILILSLLVVFSILDSLERTENPDLNRVSKISLTFLNILGNEPETTSTNLYSNKSHTIYYSIIASLLILIAIIIISLILTINKRNN